MSDARSVVLAKGGLPSLVDADHYTKSSKDLSWPSLAISYSLSLFMPNHLSLYTPGKGVSTPQAWSLKCDRAYNLSEPA
jgi:hypothetical protein